MPVIVLQVGERALVALTQLEAERRSRLHRRVSVVSTAHWSGIV